VSQTEQQQRCSVNTGRTLWTTALRVMPKVLIMSACTSAVAVAVTAVMGVFLNSRCTAANRNSKVKLTQQLRCCEGGPATVTVWTLAGVATTTRLQTEVTRGRALQTVQCLAGC
jgi:phosphoribosylpyrophosphate synthetase